MQINESFFKFIIFPIFIYGGWHQYYKWPLHHPPGVLVKEAPQQTLIAPNERPIPFSDGVYQPLADYKIRGRVLSIESYYIDRFARIAPYDLALGWGNMSDSQVIDQLSIHQAGRFYFYSWEAVPPIPVAEIQESSSNIHLIPAGKWILQKIRKLRTGSLVELTGKLVRADFRNGAEMKSSLSRKDTGAGACEVLYVEDLKIEQR